MSATRTAAHLCLPLAAHRDPGGALASSAKREHPQPMAERRHGKGYGPGPAAGPQIALIGALWDEKLRPSCRAANWAAQEEAGPPRCAAGRASASSSISGIFKPSATGL